MLLNPSQIDILQTKLDEYLEPFTDTCLFANITAPDFEQRATQLLEAIGNPTAVEESDDLLHHLFRHPENYFPLLEKLDMQPITVGDVLTTMLALITAQLEKLSKTLHLALPTWWHTRHTMIAAKLANDTPFTSKHSQREVLDNTTFFVFDNRIFSFNMLLTQDAAQTTLCIHVDTYFPDHVSHTTVELFAIDDSLFKKEQRDIEQKQGNIKQKQHDIKQEQGDLEQQKRDLEQEQRDLEQQQRHFEQKQYDYILSKKPDGEAAATRIAAEHALDYLATNNIISEEDRNQWTTGIYGAKDSENQPYVLPTHLCNLLTHTYYFASLCDRSLSRPQFITLSETDVATLLLPHIVATLREKALSYRDIEALNALSIMQKRLLTHHFYLLSLKFRQCTLKQIQALSNEACAALSDLDIIDLLRWRKIDFSNASKLKKHHLALLNIPYFSELLRNTSTAIDWHTFTQLSKAACDFATLQNEYTDFNAMLRQPLESQLALRFGNHMTHLVDTCKTTCAQLQRLQAEKPADAAILKQHAYISDWLQEGLCTMQMLLDPKNDLFQISISVYATQLFNYFHKKYTQPKLQAVNLSQLKDELVVIAGYFNCDTMVFNELMVSALVIKLQSSIMQLMLNANNAKCLAVYNQCASPTKDKPKQQGYQTLTSLIHLTTPDEEPSRSAFMRLFTSKKSVVTRQDQQLAHLHAALCQFTPLLPAAFTQQYQSTVCLAIAGR